MGSFRLCVHGPLSAQSVLDTRILIADANGSKRNTIWLAALHGDSRTWGPTPLSKGIFIYTVSHSPYSVNSDGTRSGLLKSESCSLVPIMPLPAQQSHTSTGSIRYFDIATRGLEAPRSSIQLHCIFLNSVNCHMFSTAFRVVIKARCFADDFSPISLHDSLPVFPTQRYRQSSLN
jgi:hypothetical protein